MSNKKILNNILEKKFKKIKIKYLLLFTLLNIIFLVLLKHILIRILLFLISTIILYKYGKLPFADIDPVPFTSALLFVLYDFITAWQYIFWTIPISDIISSRFNQFSFINFFSLSSSLIIAYLIKNFLNKFSTIFLIILIFNLIRFNKFNNCKINQCFYFTNYKFFLLFNNFICYISPP